MKRALLVLSLFLMAIPAAATFFHKGGLPASTPLTIAALNLSNTTFLGNSSSGTTVGQLSVLMSFGPFLGTYSMQMAGSDHSGTTCTTAGNNFAPSAGSLVTNGVVGAGSYAGVCVVATQAGAKNSPFVQAFTIVGNPNISPDGTISSAPSGQALVTLDGTWTWDGAAAGRPGEYNILLNGSSSNGGIGNLMEVNNGGQFYVDTASNGWFVWNSGAHTYVASSGPAASPTAIAPTSATASDTAAANSTITPLTVTMSDGGIFTGTCSKVSGSALFAITSSCNLAVGGSNLTPGNDGTYTIGVQATVNGRSLPSPQSITVIVAGSIACDYGPNTVAPTGTAGTDLAAAWNPMHCIANLDFTSGQTGGALLSLNMSDVNSVINQCAGTSIFGRIWVSWGRMDAANEVDDGGSAPCNRFTIGPDGSGSTALSWQYAPSDRTGAQSHSGLGMSWPECGNKCSPNVALTSLLYTEVTYRLVSGTSQPGGISIIAAFDNMPLYDGDPFMGGSKYQDFPTLELDANNSSATAWMMDNRDVNGPPCDPLNQCSAGIFLAPDATNYHTIGTLMTSDNTNMSICQYRDYEPLSHIAGAQKMTFNDNTVYDGDYCAHPVHWANQELAPHDRRNYIAVGNFETEPAINSPVIIQVKSIRIFACPNPYGRGNNCAGNIVFH